MKANKSSQSVRTMLSHLLERGFMTTAGVSPAATALRIRRIKRRHESPQSRASMALFKGLHYAASAVQELRAK